MNRSHTGADRPDLAHLTTTVYYHLRDDLREHLSRRGVETPDLLPDPAPPAALCSATSGSGAGSFRGRAAATESLALRSTPSPPRPDQMPERRTGSNPISSSTRLSCQLSDVVDLAHPPAACMLHAPPSPARIRAGRSKCFISPGADLARPSTCPGRATALHKDHMSTVHLP